MSDIEKAAQAAVDAQANTQQLELITAVLQAQQLLNTQQQPQQCQHQHDRRPGRSAGEWLGIACAICIGGVGIAFASIAIAIGGISVAILAIVLRSMWRDYQSKD